jgi:hypothetical protein
MLLWHLIGCSCQRTPTCFNHIDCSTDPFNKGEKEENGKERKKRGEKIVS